jgi:hypothetical protein
LRFYQKIDIRFLKYQKLKTIQIRPKDNEMEDCDKLSYIYDGDPKKKLSTSYQFCDIIHPDLHKLIYSIISTSTTYSVFTTYFRINLDGILKKRFPKSAK